MGKNFHDSIFILEMHQMFLINYTNPSLACQFKLGRVDPIKGISTSGDSFTKMVPICQVIQNTIMSLAINWKSKRFKHQYISVTQFIIIHHFVVSG